MSKKSGLKKFLVGAGIGAFLGVLFAPKKGSETRKELKAKLDELLEKSKEIKVDDIKDNVEAKITEIKEKIDELDKETVLKVAKKKAKEVQELAEELVDYVVEKGTPVLEKTAQTIKAKAIDLTKEILKKLENDWNIRYLAI